MIFVILKGDLSRASAWPPHPGNYVIKAELFKAKVLKHFGP